MSESPGEGGKALPQGSVDLRRLIELLISRWVAIVAVTVLAGGLALLVASLQPPVYEASTVIAITEPRWTLEFEELYTAVPQSDSAYRSFAPLATSHEVLEKVLDAYRASAGPTAETLSIQALSPMMRVRPDDEALLVTLAVRSPSPEEAAAIASLWGDVATEQANQVYGASEEHLAFLETELADAAEDLQGAERDLVGLRQRHGTSLLTLTLTSTLDTYGQYLDDQEALIYAMEEIEDLRDRLVRGPGADAAWVAQRVDLLLDALDQQALARIHLPSRPLEALSGDAPEDASVALLDDLLADLERRSEEVEERLSDLEQRILALERELGWSAAQERGLVNARDAAQSFHLALARELKETRLAARGENRVARVAAGATLPRHPVAPLTALYVGVASLLGLAVSVSAIWIRAWWQEGKLEGDRAG